MTTNSLCTESKDVFVNPCLPNPARILGINGCLRNNNYDFYVASCEFIDNSLDADAEKIAIQLTTSGGNKLIIADNGVGMDEEVIGESLKLGSDATEKSRSLDLGCFGIGMKSAAISLGRRLTVISRTNKKENWSKVVLDLEVIEEKNEFVFGRSSVTEEEQNIISKAKLSMGLDLNMDSGTIVIVDKLDRYPKINTNAMGDRLRKKVSRIYWKMLDLKKGKIKIVINGEEVKPYDPLEWARLIDRDIDDTDGDKNKDGKEDRVRGYDEDEILIKWIDHNDIRRHSQIRYKYIIFPPASEDSWHTDDRRLLKTTERSGGIILYRNNREVAYGLTLGLFQKHNTTNRVRISLDFIGEDLDNVMGVAFNKNISRDFDLGSISTESQSLSDQISARIKSDVLRAQKLIKEEGYVTKKHELEPIDNRCSQDVSDKKSGLILPKIIKEKRNTGKNGKNAIQKKRNIKKERGVGANIQLGRKSSDSVRWEEAKLGDDGKIFSCDLEGRTTVIRYNIEHPFYSYISKPSSTRRLINFMALCMATAELESRYGDGSEISKVEPDTVIRKYNNILSQNLYTLLKNDQKAHNV